MPAATEPDLVAEVDFFRSLGWPVRIDVRRRRLILTTGEALDAFRLPHAIAVPVVRNLKASELACPVCRDTFDWWTVITAHCGRGVPAEMPRELRSARVYGVPARGQVVIPPAADSNGWVSRPEPGSALPSWLAVMAVIRRVVNQQHQRP